MPTIEKHVQNMGLFFYLVASSEQQAESLTQKAVNQIKESEVLTLSDDKERTSKLYAMALSIFRKSSGKSLPTKQANYRASPFLAPHTVELGPWKQFQRKARIEDVVTVSLVGVLGLDPVIAAQVQGISEGTLKYRMSRGLKQLSTYRSGERLDNGSS